MVDIILGEHAGGCWLIRGEPLLDDLLMHTLDPGITIEIVACASGAEIQARWEAEEGGPGRGAQPWAIHPNILARVRGASGPSTLSFAPWSALIGAQEAAILDAAAARALAEGTALALADALAPDADAGLLGLAELRLQLIRQRLLEQGGGALRIRTLPRDAPGRPALAPDQVAILVDPGPTDAA